MKIILRYRIFHWCFRGLNVVRSLFLGTIDIDRLKEGTEGDKWVYDQLMPWIQRGITFLDQKALYHMIHRYLAILPTLNILNITRIFLLQINMKPNDAPMNGRDPTTEKEYLEVSYDFKTKAKVKYAYKTLPGFEEIVIKSLLDR